MIPYLDPHPEDCACRECIPSAACEHGADCDLCTGAADRHVTTGHHATCDCSACHLERYGSPNDGPPDEMTTEAGGSLPGLSPKTQPWLTR